MAEAQNIIPPRVKVILAADTNFGIGLNGKLPWKIPEELRFFREVTMNNVLIIGRKTAETLPALTGRTIYVVSRSGPSIEETVRMAKQAHPEKTVFIAGGGEVYDYVFEHMRDWIDVIYLSIVKGEYECDAFVRKFPKDFASVHTSKEQEYTRYSLMYSEMEGKYLDLLADIYIDGETHIGRNGPVLSTFGKHLQFNLLEAFPLLTTKKMFFRGIVEELLFFLRGETNTKILEEKGINIWKGNTCREFLDANGKSEYSEGEMGIMYGAQWRHFNGEWSPGERVTGGIDQLANIINLIRTDPGSRRILMTDFNPSQVHTGVLFPCHSLIIQFYVDGLFLDMFCYNRSSDVFLGLPFNITSSALLLLIVANVTNLTARHLHISLGDTHIYTEHLAMVKEQLSRVPYYPAHIRIKKQLQTVEDIERLEYGDFELIDYESWPAIRAPMVA